VAKKEVFTAFLKQSLQKVEECRSSNHSKGIMTKYASQKVPLYAVQNAVQKT